MTQTVDPNAPIHPTQPNWFLRMIEPYRRPEMVAMLLLGFASGLPLNLVFQKTSYWLRLEGIERSTIGFFYWVGLAYSFKFIWAPVIDRFKLPGLKERFGHRRSWMMVSILGTSIGLLMIASSVPSQGLWLITAGAIFLAFAGATLDISIDAWRIESAPSHRQANMAAAYSLGYRGALIFSGLGLVIADVTNWHLSFAVMALSMLVCGALILLIKEPAHPAQKAEVDHRPLLAGPANAVVVATGLFVLARLMRMMHVPETVYLSVTVLSVVVLLLGALVLKGTKTPLLYRLLLAGIGASFVMARTGLEGRVPLEASSPFFKLMILLATLGIIAAYGFVVYEGYRAISRTSAPTSDDAPRGKLYMMFAVPFLQVWGRYGKAIIPILLLVMIYRLSDFTMGVMASPLYADLGYSPTAVGAIQSGPGVAAVIFGLFLGGIAANLFGVMRSLILGALLTFLTNGAYAFFAAHADGTDLLFLASAICADNIAGGFVTTVFIAYLSSLVDPAFAATQYALFSSLFALLNKFAAGFSGVMADAVGYVNFFLITASYAIPAALLVMIVMRMKMPALEAKAAPA